MLYTSLDIEDSFIQQFDIFYLKINFLVFILSFDSKIYCFGIILGFLPVFLNL